MSEEIVYIDNMSSPRDILLVSQALEHLGLRVKEIELGAAAYINSGTVTQDHIGRALEDIGYSLIDPEAKLFTERVRSLVSVFIDATLRQEQVLSFEAFMEKELSADYAHICRRFHKLTGHRLSAFLRRMKIERAKILLTNTRLNEQEIAEKLGFKTSKTLSRIFKEVTGQAVSAYLSRRYTSLPQVV